MEVISEGRTSSFVLGNSTLEHTDKTRARGPVVILKCAHKGCFVTQIWTEEQGYTFAHPGSVDESVKVVALTRVVKQ